VTGSLAFSVGEGVNFTVDDLGRTAAYIEAFKDAKHDFLIPRKIRISRK